MPDLFANGTAHEYFLVGKEAYMQSDFLGAVDWFRNALQAQPGADAEREILDYLGFALFKTGDIGGALDLSRKILEVQPTNARIADNIEFYESVLAAGAPAKTLSALKVARDRNFTEDNLLQHSDAEMKRFRELCQGKVRHPSLLP